MVVSVSPEKKQAFEASLTVPFEFLGVTGGSNIEMDGEDWGKVAAWKDKYTSTLTDLMSSNE